MTRQRPSIALAALAALVAPSAAVAQASASPFTHAQRYDAMGRVTGTISASPNDGNPFLAVRNSYNPAGRLVTIESGSLSAWQSEAVAPGSWSGFTVYRSLEIRYDPMGRRTRETSREGAAGTIGSFTQMSYDIMGRLDCTAVRMNPAQFGALPDSAACSLGVLGSDGPDRITKNIYDAAGQRIQLRQGVGTNDAAAEATWRYNLDGQVVTVIDGNGNRAELCYDGHGRQSRWVFPSPARAANFVSDPVETALLTAGAANGDCSATGGDFESYSYDPNGNRTYLRKRDGSTLTYQYDALNRLSVKIVPERTSGAQALSTAQTRDVYYGYDLRNLQLYARFDSVSGPGIANHYDGFGRLVSSTADTDGVARTLAYQYDTNGARTRITHPDNNGFVTVRDGLGRAFWLESGDNGACYYSSYRPDGLPASQSRCNGASTWTSRDGVGRLNGLGHYYGTGGIGDVLWLYQHNAANQISSVTRDNDSYAWTGHYAVNRAYTTNGLNQHTAAVSTLGSANYSHDANGNLTSDGTRTYIYDVENRLVSASPGPTLSYDPLGRLYQITASNGTITRFLYDGDALIAEYNAAGEMTRRYLHWDGADMPLISYSNASLASHSYLHADHQGSIVGISNASGVSQINRYDEYGIPASTNAGRFQFTGQVWLGELGLYYYKARIYSPTLGRFLQTDPIGYQDQFNLYAYVGNEPVNRADPSGRDSIIFIQPNGDMRIILPIQFHGDAATPANIAAISNSIQNTFSGNFNGINVTTTVVPLTQAEVDAGAPVVNRMEIASGPLTTGSNDGHSYTTGGYDAHVTMYDQSNTAITHADGSTSTGDKGAWTGAHEGGHLLGMPDTHQVGSGLMDRGPGTAVTQTDMNTIAQPDTPSGARNSVTHCPSPASDCPQ